jgi:hypothetical protein
VEAPAAPRLRTIALPVEHGGWGLLLEPILLGLTLRPTWAGACLGVAALAAFLARHPLRLVAGDLRRGTRHLRTRVAALVAAAYLLGALLVLMAAVALAGGTALLAPIAFAVPLAALQLVRDAQGRSRELAPEVAGASALAATAAAIALAGGPPPGGALLLWAILAARAATAVLYVRARLRLDRGAPQAGRGIAVASHALTFAAAAALALAGVLPWLAVVALALLLARAAHGVSRHRERLAPKELGWQEARYASLALLLLVLGFALGI